MPDDVTPDEVVPAEKATDPDAIASALMGKLGPQLGTMVADAVNAKVKDLGLDAVDRKHGIAPGIEGADEDEPDPKARQAAFLKAAIFGPQTPLEIKALSEGTTTAGGYLVPDDFRAEVIMRANGLVQLYPKCYRFTSKSDAMKVPNLATDVSMSWDEAENADFDESDPVFGETSFSLHRCNAITYTSRELADDGSVGILDLLTRLFSEAIARERDKVIVIGDGSDQPEGIFSASGITTVSSIGAVAYADLVRMDEEIADQYRDDPSLCWITNKAVRRYIRGVKDDNGRPLLVDPVNNGGLKTLLDHPVCVNTNVPTGQIALGAMSKFWIMDREQMGFESTTSGGDTFKKHQVGLKVWERWDGKLVHVTDCWVKGTDITS